MIFVYSLLANLKKSISDRARESESRMVFLGLFCLLASLPYYFINQQILNSDHYDSLWLRAIITLLSLLIVLKKYWPKSAIPYLPLYWYLMLMYSMPFFITFMTLKNHGASIWVMNFISIVILMMLLVDWVSYTIILGFGLTLAFISFKLTTVGNFIYIPGVVGYVDILNTIIPSIIIGIIFSHNRERYEKEKIELMQQLAANLAHELRTPLAGIKAGASALNDYFPELFETYQLAKQANMKIPVIYDSQFKRLELIINNVEIETQHANNFIDMLLVNVRQFEISTKEFINCTMSECIEKALARYPFSGEEQQLIIWNNANDFIFRGNELLTIHIFFNLIRNALYYIRVASKGNIEIIMKNDPRYNYVYFKDTGTGIAFDVLPYIFDRFYSKTYHGYGVGLSYCYMVMRKYGGNIVCSSKLGEFTEFVLSFPKIIKN